MYCSRYLCDVLEEMRTALKTLRFDCFPGLIEEAQTLGNRMESALEEVKYIENIHDTLHNLKKEKKSLEREIKDLERKKEDLKENS